MTTHLLQTIRDADQRHVLDLVRDFDGDNTGAVNVLDSLNALGERIRNGVVDNRRIPLLGYIPPGEYLLDVSTGAVDWTGIICFNTRFIANNAIFYANGAGKNVIEGLNSRGLHIEGLTIVGDKYDSPRCGFLIGNKNTDTNGNNYFVRDHRGLSTACDVIMALTSEVRLPIRTAACPLRAEPCGC